MKMKKNYLNCMYVCQMYTHKNRDILKKMWKKKDGALANRGSDGDRRLLTLDKALASSADFGERRDILKSERKPTFQTTIDVDGWLKLVVINYNDHII